MGIRHEISDLISDEPGFCFLVSLVITFCAAAGIIQDTSLGRSIVSQTHNGTILLSEPSIIGQRIEFAANGNVIQRGVVTRVAPERGLIVRTENAGDVLVEGNIMGSPDVAAFVTALRTKGIDEFGTILGLFIWLYGLILVVLVSLFACFGRNTEDAGSKAC